MAIFLSLYYNEKKMQYARRNWEDFYMPVIKELIKQESDGTISFGNYTLPQKSKVSDFEYEAAVYKVKTFSEITKLEKDGLFLYESVPGTTVHHFRVTENGVRFSVEGEQDVQITLELEEGKEYKVYIDETNIGKIKTGLGGKLSFGVELRAAEQVDIMVAKL